MHAVIQQLMMRTSSCNFRAVHPHSCRRPARASSVSSRKPHLPLAVSITVGSPSPCQPQLVVMSLVQESHKAQELSERRYTGRDETP